MIEGSGIMNKNIDIDDSRNMKEDINKDIRKKINDDIGKNISEGISKDTTNTIIKKRIEIYTFISFAHYYSQESFTQKSMLITLKISLGYYIIDFKLMKKYLEMIYKAVPRYLSEHMLFSNLIVNKDNVNNIIKLINYNQVNKYLLEFNFKSSKDVYSSKINNSVYTQNRDFIDKTRYLLKKIIHYNKGKEKKHKKLLFEYIISFTLQKKEIVLQTKDENE